MSRLTRETTTLSRSSPSSPSTNANAGSGFGTGSGSVTGMSTGRNRNRTDDGRRMPRPRSARESENAVVEVSHGAGSPPSPVVPSPVSAGSGSAVGLGPQQDETRERDRRRALQMQESSRSRGVQIRSQVESTTLIPDPSSNSSLSSSSAPYITHHRSHHKHRHPHQTEQQGKKDAELTYSSTVPHHPRTQTRKLRFDLNEMVFSLLRCSACENVFDHPTTLICGHTVCSKHVMLSVSTPHSYPPSPVPSAFPASLPPSPHIPSSPRTPSTPSTPSHSHAHLFPSCPIPTCYLPSGGGRTLRKRRAHLPDPEENLDDPDQAPILTYIPPPLVYSEQQHPPSNSGSPAASTATLGWNGRNRSETGGSRDGSDTESASGMMIPPPPTAVVKVSHPKMDVTLSKVIEIVGRFVDLTGAGGNGKLKFSDSKLKSKAKLKSKSGSGGESPSGSGVGSGSGSSTASSGRETDSKQGTPGGSSSSGMTDQQRISQSSSPSNSNSVSAAHTSSSSSTSGSSSSSKTPTPGPTRHTTQQPRTPQPRQRQSPRPRSSFDSLHSVASESTSSGSAGTISEEEGTILSHPSSRAHSPVSGVEGLESPLASVFTLGDDMETDVEVDTDMEMGTGTGTTGSASGVRSGSGRRFMSVPLESTTLRSHRPSSPSSSNVRGSRSSHARSRSGTGASHQQRRSSYEVGGSGGGSGHGHTSRNLGMGNLSGSSLRRIRRLGSRLSMREGDILESVSGEDASGAIGAAGLFSSDNELDFGDGASFKGSAGSIGSNDAIIITNEHPHAAKRQRVGSTSSSTSSVFVGEQQVDAPSLSRKSSDRRHHPSRSPSISPTTSPKAFKTKMIGPTTSNLVTTSPTTPNFQYEDEDSAAMKERREKDLVALRHRQEQVERELSALALSINMREELVKALVSELTCEICYSLFFDPVTTPCQHTFCSKCLLRALDHSGLCPLCRDELPGYAFHHNHPSNTILDNLIMTLLPEQYEQRKQAYLADESLALGTNGVSVPIFPCALAFPGMPISLNIFEPRYRLMIRRCLENGTHSFGMTMLPNPNTGEEVMYGTMLEMKSVRMLPDGRSAIETVGSYRFKIKERAWMDGYIIARIERVDDYTPEMEAMIDRMPMSSSQGQSTPISTSPGSNTILLPVTPAVITMNRNRRLSSSRSENLSLTQVGVTDPHQQQRYPGLSQQHSYFDYHHHQQQHGQAQFRHPIQAISMPSSEELVAVCHAFIERMKKRVAPWVIQRMNETYGPVPDDPAKLSFWMALVLPVDDYDKVKLLPLRSPRLRLRLIVHWIEAMESQHWWSNSGCLFLGLMAAKVIFDWVLFGFLSQF